MHQQAAVLVTDVRSQLPHGTLILKLSLPYMLQKIASLDKDGRMHLWIQAIRFCLSWQLLCLRSTLKVFAFKPVHLVPLAPVAEMLEDTLLILYWSLQHAEAEFSPQDMHIIQSVASLARKSLHMPAVDVACTPEDNLLSYSCSGMLEGALCICGLLTVASMADSSKGWRTVCTPGSLDKHPACSGDSFPWLSLL